MKALMGPSLVRFTTSLVAAGLALAAAIAGPASAQEVAPPLTGENLFGTPVVTEDCDPETGPPSISYTVTGLAEGPYPGTFAENGKATFGPPLFGVQPVLSYVASFTIEAEHLVLGSVHITGTKELDPTVDSVGECQAPNPFLSTHAFVAFALYEAEISTASGTCATGGDTEVEVTEEASDDPNFVFIHFNEFFATGTPCVPVCPPGEDGDNDGLIDSQENLLLTVLDDSDSDDDGIVDGNDDANGNGEDDEDEDDGDECPDEDGDGDGEDDEDEDDDEDDD
jgi:hypothetical protein